MEKYKLIERRVEFGQIRTDIEEQKKAARRLHGPLAAIFCKMNEYKCLLINDSGAIELSDRFLDNIMPDAATYIKNIKAEIEPTAELEFEMYDDREFNRVNDILHSPDNYIVNDKLKDIICEMNLPEYGLGKAKIIRKESNFLFLRKKVTYEYCWLYFKDNGINEMYKQIDFEKSSIEVYQGKERIENRKINQMDDIYELMSENQELIQKGNYEYMPFTWRANYLQMKRDFDGQIDIFELPLFSWMTYVSPRLQRVLENNQITDIRFIPTGQESRLSEVRNPKIMF